jgi:hypothetical protein
MNSTLFSRLAATTASVATTLLLFSAVVSLSGHPQAGPGVQLAVAAAVAPAAPR